MLEQREADPSTGDTIRQHAGAGLASLRLQAPFTFAVMAQQMIAPPRWLLDAYGVPKSVRREAFRDDPVHRANIVEGLRPLRDLMLDIGVLPPVMVPVWKALGIWGAEPRRLASGNAAGTPGLLPSAGADAVSSLV